MSRKVFSAEQIIGKPREAEILLSKGQAEGEVVRKLGLAGRRIIGGEKTTVQCR